VVGDSLPPRRMRLANQLRHAKNELNYLEINTEVTNPEETQFTNIHCNNSKVPNNY